MEELKNNVTSEKKETIEPVEVITPENDENQVAEETMDSPVIRRGDIYRIEENEWRVFIAKAKMVAVINMNTHEIRKIKTNIFIGHVKDKLYESVSKEADHSYAVSPEEMEIVNKRADILESIIIEEEERIERLLTKRMPKNKFDTKAILLGVSKRQLRRMLLSYLLSGRNKFSLVDQRKNNSRPKNSHSKDYENPKNDVDEILKYGLKMFVKYGKPGHAYDAVLRRYFREPVEVPDGSSVRMVTLPEEERSVSYKMLYNYIRKHTEDYSCKGKDERDKQNNNRQLVGNSRTGVYELGQIVEADEMELGCYVVDQNDGETVLGKAVVYCMVEVLSGICIGAYVSLENNSMRGFQQVFLSLLEPHKNQTQGYSIDYDEEDWPSMIVPDEIRCDRGSEYMSRAYSKAMGELGIRNTPVPPGCGSLKGVVESFNGLVQTYLKAQLKNNGYVEDKYRGGDLAKGDACLTLEEIRGLVYQSVILYNL